MMEPILIGLGANLPAANGAPPLAACLAAVALLSGLPGLRLSRLSGWWDSPAWPDPSAPRYVNGVARLAGSIGPEPLLAALHAIEAGLGRLRGAPNAPRTLDLDLLAMGGLVRGAAPVLPHPRLSDRAFVVLPIVQVAPDWVHPVLGKTASALAEALPEGHGCRPLATA
jgi:2-amino-4-hydroxy-6-hydroxymethyldihydropteridine diphosphokinase